MMPRRVESFIIRLRIYKHAAPNGAKTSIRSVQLIRFSINWLMLTPYFLIQSSPQFIGLNAAEMPEN